MYGQGKRVVGYFFQVPTKSMGPIVENSTNLDHLKNPFSFMSRINSLTKRKQIETKPI
jgi:hypothetical protein